MKSNLLVILLLFFTFSFLFKSDYSFDQDLGRHIKLGGIILNTWSIPKTNLFSYTNADFPFINTHWFFEVFVYLVAQYVGLQPLLFIKLVVLLASVWLTLKIIPKENRVFLIPVGFIFLHVLRERTELRPEIFSFLFTALTLYILDKFNKTKTKLIYLLPIFQLMWINTHIYFFVGFALQIIFLIFLGYRNLRLHLEGLPAGQAGVKLKFLGIIFVISVLVSLINPNGLEGLLYPLNVTKNYGYTIVENQTMFFLENISFRDPNFLFVKISFAIAILSIIVGLIRRRATVLGILFSLFGLALALLNVRSFPYLVFLSLPAVLQNFGNIKKSSLTHSFTTLFILLLIAESFLYLNGSYYKFRDDSNIAGIKFVESSKGALDFVIKNNLPTPIFNNFDIGSYIIYRGYPGYKVFVDGRPEAYPKEFFSNTYIPIQYDHNKFKELDQKIGFKTIIFSHTDQTPWGSAFLKQIVQNKDWVLVYIDNFIVVLVKEDVSVSKNLSKIDLKSLSPEFYRYDNHVSYLRLGLFLLNTANNEAGIQFIQKALQVFPGSPIANSIMASLTNQTTYLDKSKSRFFW